jgi:hypothetical protein
MESYAGHLLIGALVGTVAMRLIPARQHDARGLAFLASLLGGLLAGGLLAALNVPSLATWLAAFVGSAVAGIAVANWASDRQNGTQARAPHARRQRAERSGPSDC